MPLSRSEICKRYRLKKEEEYKQSERERVKKNYVPSKGLNPTTLSGRRGHTFKIGEDHDKIEQHFHN